jgi:hypothetical protein
MAFAETSSVEKAHLVDLSTGEDVAFLFNPEQLNEQISVEYSRRSVPGMSHQPLQYQYTGNHQVMLDIYLHGVGDTKLALIDDIRRFLLSLCYPKGNAGSIDDGAPPRVLFVWPSIYSMTCVVRAVNNTASQFRPDGKIVRSIASVTLEEIRDARLTSDTVRRHGTRRSSAGGNDTR